MTGDSALSDGIRVRLTEKDRENLDSAAMSEETGPVALARRFILDGLKRFTRRKGE